MRPGLALARRPWVATGVALAMCCGPLWAHTPLDTSAPEALAPQVTQKVTISTWARTNGQTHEVATYRPDLAPVLVAGRSLPIERVYVVPGSGCTGMAPILPGYFDGLAAREIVVLHKRHVQAHDWPRPIPCRAGFIQNDELPTWTQAWQEFLAWDLQRRPAPLPRVMLLGISEGAEVIPTLMMAWPDVGMAVLLGSTGLDPWEALLLQLAREQDMAFAEQLQQQLDAPDASSTALIGGRSLNYWRTLRHWPVAAPIGKSRVPTLVLMGAADQAQAPAGLARFEARHHRSMLCTRLIAGADHGLKQKAGRWPGTWPLVQSLMAAPDAQVFAQRCAPTD